MSAKDFKAWTKEVMLGTVDVRPKWSPSVPMCDEECPSFDGKRCSQMGFRPGNICEPAVQAVVGDSLHWFLKRKS
jgi:hypothetical protein